MTYMQYCGGDTNSKEGCYGWGIQKLPASTQRNVGKAKPR